jgi:hypothetical protein
MSIQAMIFPPKIVPSAFASEGSTISVMVTEESRGGFGDNTLVTLMGSGSLL